MMGWRLGYIAYPNADTAVDPEVGFQMSKVQDTIPICVTQMSQVAALGALEAGSAWVRQQVEGLAQNRSVCLSICLSCISACLVLHCAKGTPLHGLIQGVEAGLHGANCTTAIPSPGLVTEHNVLSGDCTAA